MIRLHDLVNTPTDINWMYSCFQSQCTLLTFQLPLSSPCCMHPCLVPSLKYLSEANAYQTRGCCSGGLSFHSFLLDHFWWTSYSRPSDILCLFGHLWLVLLLVPSSPQMKMIPSHVMLPSFHRQLQRRQLGLEQASDCSIASHPSDPHSVVSSPCISVMCLAGSCQQPLPRYRLHVATMAWEGMCRNSLSGRRSWSVRVSQFIPMTSLWQD